MTNDTSMADRMRIARSHRLGGEARFWSKVDRRAEGCWLWTGNLEPHGYAKFGADGRRVYAHRFAYELLVGPIPNGRVIDHRCLVRHCVNPEHLRLATIKQNNENQSLEPRKHNTSGYRGVSWDRAKGAWHAYVNHNGRRHFLGYFDSAAEAGEVTRLKRIELFTHNDADRVA